ncbi:MAG: amino acid permease [Terriglobia bacterium]
MSGLFSRKPLETIFQEAQEREGGLRRALGPVQLTALGIGAIIGAGIFVLSGLGAHTYAGPALMLSFVVSGLGCAFAALCYAEFAAMIPLAGSAYTYAYATLGEFLAWIIGWDLVLEYGMGASTVSSGWSNHVVVLLRDLGIKLPLWLSYDHWTAARKAAQMGVPLDAPTIFGWAFGWNVPATLIVLLIATVLAIGIRESASINAVIVAIKVSVVLFVIVMGLQYINRDNWGHDWRSFAPFGAGGIWEGAAYIFFAYIGFDAVSTTAQEVRNPQRNLPIGILVSLGVCTLLYILVAAVLTGMVPYKEIDIEAPIAEAFLRYGLHAASGVITAGAIAGLTSVMLVMLLGQTRVFYAMASDGLLPKGIFGWIHPRFRTPFRITLITGGLVSVVGGFLPIEDLAKLVNIGTLLAFVIVCVAVMVLRVKRPEIHRPFRVPLMPFVPLLGIGFNGYMMIKLGWVNWMRLLVWLAIGLVIYFSYGVRHSHLRKADIRASAGKSHGTT